MSLSEILHKNNQINKTFDYVCTTLEIKEEDVKSRQRYGKLVKARKLFTMLLVASSDLTLTEIGAAMNRKHDMIIYYRDAVQDERSFNKTLDRYYDNHLKQYHDFLQEEFDTNLDDYLVSRKDVSEAFSSAIKKLDLIPIGDYVKNKVVLLLREEQSKIVNR